MTDPQPVSACCPVCGHVGGTMEGVKLLAGKHLLVVDDQTRYLTKAQYAIVELLFRRAPRTVTYWALYEAMPREGDHDVCLEIVKVTACAIRHKLKGTALEGKLTTSWGKGYAMELAKPILPIFAEVDEV